MEGRGRGVECFVSQSYFIGGQCFNNFVAYCSMSRYEAGGKSGEHERVVRARLQKL